MRVSDYFIPTLRDVPAETEVISHNLMMRAGMIRQVASGIYNYLPLGLKVIKKVEEIVRRYMNMAGGVEVLMPSIIPSELWRESNRWDYYGKELLRIKDRHNREFCFGPTHEEVITDIVRNNVSSYKQLPINMYQIQTKFRDEIRPRFGLMRGREFIMKDAYSFDVDDSASERSYRTMYETYTKIFEDCGLRYKVVEADSGAIGGTFSHEFMVLAETGEDELISCKACGYSANIEKAGVNSKGELNKSNESKLEEISTPGMKSVEEVAHFIGTERNKIVKTMILNSDLGFFAVLIRGDHELNLAKIKIFLGASIIRFANDTEIIEATGGPVGFSGPIGIDIPIYADNSIKYIQDFVVGACKGDAHFINVNAKRDFLVSGFGDFRNAAIGDTCIKCGEVYEVTHGIEVGHIFKLGTKYSSSMGAYFLDHTGKRQLAVMGCYGIGIGRTVAASIEQNHDDKGIIWPVQLAPFEVDIISINTNDEKVLKTSERIYKELLHANIDVIYDNRKERAGVKFCDAELIGYPLRINVGKKSLIHGMVDITIRKFNETISVNENDVTQKTIELLKDLKLS